MWKIIVFIIICGCCFVVSFIVLQICVFSCFIRFWVKLISLQIIIIFFFYFFGELFIVIFCVSYFTQLSIYKLDGVVKLISNTPPANSPIFYCPPIVNRFTTRQPYLKSTTLLHCFLLTYNSICTPLWILCRGWLY